MLPPNLYARVPPFAMCIGTRDRGCGAHPVFPAPSEQEGGKFLKQTSGAMRREIAAPYSVVIVRLVRNCTLGRTIQYSRDSSD
ncbi:hypothetical protein V1293_004832 [Bradyrhizobium sp. AZCC 1693]